MNRHVLSWLCATAALVAITTSDANAQSCNFTVSSLSFGTVDTLSGSDETTTATINVSCSLGPSNGRIMVCPNIGDGSYSSAPSGNPRLLGNGSNRLQFQLYSDSGYTTPWGSYVWPYAPRSPLITLATNFLGSGSTSATIYGKVLGGQSLSQTGTYTSSFSGHTLFAYQSYSGTPSCSASLSRTATPTFTVSATVAGNCLVDTQDVDFGATGALTSNIDAVGQVRVKCTPGTAYAVALNTGQNGSGQTTRKMAQGSEMVSYELYRDAARTLVWGRAPGSNVVSGTGSGAYQNLPVYGRVPPQTTPSQGTYTDNVVVTITY